MRNYFVKRPKRTIEPEEILLDPVAASGADPHERLEFPVSPFWGRFFLGLFSAALLGLAALTFYYQLVRGSDFLAQADENRLRFLFEEAPRGAITDRYGTPLAANRTIFDVLVFSLDLPKDEEVLGHHARIIARYLGFEADFAFDALRRIQEKNLAEPAVLAADILRSRALALKSRERELNGIRVQVRYQRHYPGGPAFAHVIGFTGKVSAEEAKSDSRLRLGDSIGRQGIEASRDGALRGVRGEIRYEVDARLSTLTEKERIPAEPGKNIVLTLDAELQEYFYEVMQSQVAAFGLDRGAGVALDPRTGEILALVSLPSFDNNLFAKGISQAAFDRLATSRAKPLFHRAVSGEYSPGSAIKPFIAAAALQEGTITPDTRLVDVEGKIAVPNPYDLEKPTIFRDWKIHGSVTVRDALAQSSNVFFYTTGGGLPPKGEGRVAPSVAVGSVEGLGIERMKRYLSGFGFGSALGVDLPGEHAGFVPDPAWKAEARKSDPIWRIGDTYLVSIGQGDLTVTPLQLAAGTAAIANGGALYAPYVVAQIADNEKIGEEFSPQRIRGGFVDPKWLKVVREGMRLAVTGGTAAALADLPLKVAGKTGTAQILSNAKTNAFFTAFAPMDDPEIVLAVVVEEGRGGMTNAVPVAQEVFRWWWANRYQQQATGH